ncbi:MAG: hypothetical protein LC105_12135 [Chitinophagales bacterium]|jgi:hypothetical protein|nr:hypothetical protein [Chitinophagales bacterium]
MRIFARDIRITAITQFSCTDIILGKKLMIYKTIVKDKNVLNKIEELLKGCIFDEEYEGDAKIVCLLRSSSGEDTLSFYGGNIMIFNGRKAELSIRLLDIVSSYLPPEQQESVEDLLRYINRKSQKNRQ